MRCAIVIPARMSSTRFPGKPLCDLNGKPMIQWVWEASIQAGIADEVIVATPDSDIISSCQSFGAKAVLTSESCQSGTDRIAEICDQLIVDILVNVQGDEPLISPHTIRACAQPLLEDDLIPMGSAFSICPDSEIDNPAVVKVVTDIEGFALYFSRYSLPYPRNDRKIPVKKHVGIYAYRRDAVRAFSKWPVSALEATEGLEQLRFLENGVRIMMSEVQGTEIAVDTPEQAEQVRALLKTRTMSL